MIQSIKIQHFLQPLWRNSKKMLVGFANSGWFQSIKIQIFFNRGEEILRKCQWISLLLGDFRISNFEILFSYGEGTSENCQYIWLLLGGFATSNFKIWTLKKNLNIKINYGELGKCQEISFILGHFWKCRSKFSSTIMRDFQESIILLFRVVYEHQNTICQ